VATGDAIYFETRFKKIYAPLKYFD